MKNNQHLPPPTTEVGAQTPASPIQRILLSDEKRLDLFINIVVGDLR